MDTGASSVWRSHPDLQGRFHLDYPDDIEIAVHDGGPRITDRQPEIVWIAVTSLEHHPFADVFAGTVLNQPERLRTVREKQSVRFLMPAGSQYPVMVTDKYLAERGDWSISVCSKCGMSELFDAPSDLIKKAFPNQHADVILQMFTTFCPICGSARVLSMRDEPSKPYTFVIEEKAEQAEPSGPETAASRAERKWWQFWR